MYSAARKCYCRNCCCRAVVAAGATPRGVARAKARRGVAVVVVVVAVVVGVGVALCSGSSSSSSSSSNASSKVSPAISRSGRSRKNCASSRPQGSAQAMGSANTTSQSHLSTAGIPAQASSIGVSQAWLAAMLHGNRAPPETQPTRRRRAVAEGVVQAAAVSGLANDACIPAGG